ncbi:MAG: nucleotide exchange factor GrpE [Acidobacteria bacterium]|nr:nucleotide exchange factor GrpE [Acidobacteriota bacterium]MCA1611488.1 nucleotide exchange factor GrpE [Acidobacteriota bacterium]
MRDREEDIGVAADPDRIEVEDSGDSLETALAEEERSAIAAAEEKLQSVMNDLEDLKDRHRRKLAEFENMRKRTEREKSEYLRVALGRFVGDFLTISDDFDRALAHATPEETASDFGQGVGLIQRKLAELWKKYGLVEVDTSGSFDPNVHEAVATEPSDDLPKDTIVDVLGKGYLLNDKLIRPALVKVTVKGDGDR